MTASWECGCDHWGTAFEVVGEEEGDEFDLRKFNPSTYGFRADAVPSELLSSDCDCCTTVLLKPPASNDRLAIALYADGACAGNGTPQARASVGVYGRPDAWYNQGYLLPSNVPQTNQSAEIHSAIAALDVARAIIKKRWERIPLPEDGHVFTQVLIVMDSSYVVRAMTEWIRKWRANGFRNTRGEPVANMKALLTLDNQVRALFYDHLIIVRFWHVPRIHNSGADRLAGEALRGNPVNPDGLDSDLDELTQRFAQKW